MAFFIFFPASTPTQVVSTQIGYFLRLTVQAQQPAEKTHENSSPRSKKDAKTRPDRVWFKDCIQMIYFLPDAYQNIGTHKMGLMSRIRRHPHEILTQVMGKIQYIPLISPVPWWAMMGSVFLCFQRVADMLSSVHP